MAQWELNHIRLTRLPDGSLEIILPASHASAFANLTAITVARLPAYAPEHTGGVVSPAWVAFLLWNMCRMASIPMISEEQAQGISTL